MSNSEIRLFTQGDCWVMEYEGKAARKARDRYGDTVVLTPFLACADERQVINRIAARNPDADVYSPHYSVVR